MNTIKMEVNDIKNLTGPSLSMLNDDSQQVEKLKPLELLKMKICKSHDLIMNYNDKIKECTSLKTSLEQAQVELEKIKTNYNKTLSKNIKLELQNAKFRKSLEDSTKKIANLETKIAGDQRLIHQLTCKIADNDKNEEKIKNLEQEIKSLKRTLPNKKKATKNQGVNTDDVEITDFDSSLNAEANLLEDRLRGSEFKENTSSSLLCVKCEAAFEKMIATVESPKPLISPFSSPNPYLYPNEDQNYTEPVYSPKRGRAVVEPEHLTDPPKEKNPASEIIKTLERRLKNLERKIKEQKKTQDKNRCCHSNQNIMLEMWNKLLDKEKSCETRKCKKKLKRCKSERKEISKKKGKRKTSQNWSIESTAEYEEAAVCSISKDRTSICEPDDLRQKNSAKVIPNLVDKIILSTEKNPEVKIGESFLEQDASEFPVSKKERELISVSSSFQNESENSTLIVENSNYRKGNKGFEMIKVSHEKISVSSPNIEPSLIRKKDIISKEPLTLPQVILEQEESVIISKSSKDEKQKSDKKVNHDFEMLEIIHEIIRTNSPNNETPKLQEKGIVSKVQEKQTNIIKESDFDMLEVSHDKISASSPNNEPPKVQEKDVVFKEPSILQKEILNSAESILNQENQTNATKESTFEMLEVRADKISEGSTNTEILPIQEKDIVSKEPSILQKEISVPTESILNYENQTKAIKESAFKILEERADKISAGSTNTEILPIQEKDIVSKEPSILQKEISDPTESILNQEKQTDVTKQSTFDMLEVSHNKMSASSPNTETLFIQEKDLVSKKFPTLPKVITEPEESELILEKSKENSTNAKNENNTLKVLEVTNDEISPDSPNIIETLKILGIQEDTPKEVLNKSSTSVESRKILENRIQSVKRKVSSPEENLDNINNSTVPGEHSRKMIRRRLTSHYSTDSLDIRPIKSSSDFQSLDSKKTCSQILVTNPEKRKVNETPEEIFETDEGSITDKVQIIETTSSFGISEGLESTEDISQELTNYFSGKRKSVLQDDLALSDDEPPEEIKSKSSSSLEDASDIFISNTSNKNLSKNFIQGKRSSDLLLTIISPVNQKKKKKNVEIVKNSKPGNRGTLLSKIRTLKRRTNKILLTPKIQQSKELKIQVPKSGIEKVNPDDNVASNSLLPNKKRRIAHTPKAGSESGSVPSFEDFPLEIPLRKSLRSATKSPEKVKNSRVKSSEQKLINLEVKEEKSPVRKKGRPKKVKSTEVNLEVNLPNEVETTEESLRIADLNQSLDKSPSKSLEKNPVQENVTAVENDLTSMKNTSSEEDIALSSRIGIENEYWKNANQVTESIKETEENDAGNKQYRELRSTTQGVRLKFLPVHRRDPILQTHYVIKLLNESFDAKPSVDFSLKSKLSQVTLEKNVKLHLAKLVNSKSWTMELHLDVKEKICGLCQTSTAAKCIVSFLQQNFLENEEPLDKTYTPPAPMMSRTQQKIVTLITSLEKSMPNIVYHVTAGIDFSLFRLNTDYKDKKVVEGLARVYIALVRLKKDREKARLFCYDALYSLRNTAINVIYVVLTCWPEVFPICDTNPEILPKCMAHIILTSEGCGFKYPKVNALKNLISAYYRYPKAEYFSKHLVVEFLSALKQKHESSTDMAIILLGKKEGPDWTYKNIIQGGLLQMIVEKTHPSVYDAFNLLGNLMRTFPKEDEQNYIGKTVQQLCDLLDSGQGTEDHLEGVATALLSLSMFTKYLNKVAKSLLLWKPKQILRTETLTKFKFFFQAHSVVAWHEFIKQDYTVLTESRKNNIQNRKTQLNTTQGQTKKKKNKKFQAKKADTSVKIPSNS